MDGQDIPLKNKKAQVIMEYLILVVAVVFVLILFIFSPGMPFRTIVNGVLQAPLNLTNSMSNQLQI